MVHFKRRSLLAALGTFAVANPLVVVAQSVTKLPRVGVLSGEKADLDFVRTRQRQMHESFARAGYQVGRDILVDWRFAEGNHERLRELADELLRLKVDLIVTWSSPATHAAAQATKTIPIVMHAYDLDPVKRGLIRSFARPGGNLTGTTWFIDPVEQTIKNYEILKHALPSAVRMASLWTPWGEPNYEELVSETHDRIYKRLGVVVVSFPVYGADDIPSALDRIAAMKPDALYVMTAGVIRSRLSEIAAFAVRQKLPSIGSSLLAVTEGGLLFYGPDVVHIVDRTVYSVVRILRGAKPGDLPVQQPDKYELLLNAKTARAIGFTLPPGLQLRVDRVIE